MTSEGGLVVAATVLALFAAILQATGATLTKGLVDRLPALQLIGPLFGVNCLLLLPLAPFENWRWSPRIVALHLASVAVQSVAALSVFSLYQRGSASAVATAQAISPLPVVLAVGILLPGHLEPIHVVAALVVVTAVLAALSDTFEGIGRTRAVSIMAVAACANGMLTVLARLLFLQGVGLVETYVVRTAVCCLLFTAGVPPRNIPVLEAPRLLLRGAFITGYFVLVILGIQRGSPAVVQTAVATSPLWLILSQSFMRRSLPARRLALAAGAAVLGVGMVAFTR